MHNLERNCTFDNLGVEADVVQDLRTCSHWEKAVELDVEPSREV